MWQDAEVLEELITTDLDVRVTREAKRSRMRPRCPWVDDGRDEMQRLL